MAVTREQAILEMVLEFGSLLRDFDVVSSRYDQLTQQIRQATDNADIDQLEREARESGDEMQRLGREARNALGKIERGSEDAGLDVRELRQETERLDTAIDRAEDEMADFNRQGDRIGRTTGGVQRLRAAWVAAAGAVFVLVRGIRAVIEVSDRQAAVEAQVRAAIESTGGAAGVTAEELSKMAAELQQVTTFGDETILGMQSLLLTFTALRKQELPEISERILDLATALEAASSESVDLRSITVQVAKALQDPIRGVTQLRRSGIDFTESQREQIKVLVESNRLYEAQRLILDALSEQVGGRARAATESLGGAFKQLSNSAGDLLEEIGQQGLNEELTVLARLLNDNSGGATQFAKSIGQTLAFLVGGIGRLVQGFQFAQGLVALALEGILKGISGLVKGADRLMSALLKIIQSTFESIAKLIPDIDLPGQVDDQLRRWSAKIAEGFGRGREAATREVEGIIESIDRLAESFDDVGVERIEAAQQVGEALRRIREELKGLADEGKGLRPVLDDGADALDEFRNQLFGNAEALEVNAKRIVALVDSIGGLANATPAQFEKIRDEVQGLVDGFALVGERPPIALEILAKQMGVTASSIKSDAKEATESLRDLIDTAEEAAKVPATTFRADLELDEGSIRERLSAVQERLSEVQGGLLIDPSEEVALLDEEADLLIQLSRAERAWTEAQEQGARATRDASQSIRDLTGLQSDLTGEIQAAAGEWTNYASALDESQSRIGEFNSGVEVSIDNVDDAARVTLPALSESTLQASKDSGELDASLEAIADRLLVTANNAEAAGEGLAAAGELGAAGQREAARESKGAADEVKRGREEAERWLTTSRELLGFWQENGPQLAAAVAGIRAEFAGAADECQRLDDCSGG